MIRFACPGCSATYTVGLDRAGKVTKCPKCQTKFLIPNPDHPADVPPPPPPAPAPPPVAPAPAAQAPPPLPQPAAHAAGSPPPAPDVPVEINPCPRCRTRLSVLPSDLGLDVECPSCQTVFKAIRPGALPPLPPPRPAPAPAPAPAPPPLRPSAAPPAPPPAPPRKSVLEATDDTGKPKPRRRDDEDDRPSRRRRDEDDDDRPSRRGRREDDDEDDRPSRRRRRDDDDEDDEDDRPARRRSRRVGGGGGSPMRIISASLSLLIGAVYLLCGVGLMVAGGSIMSLVMGLPTDDAPDPGMADKAKTAVGVATGVLIGCGVGVVLFSLLYLGAGMGALMRSGFGKVLTLIAAAVSILLGVLTLIGLFGALVSGEVVQIGVNFLMFALFAGHVVTSFMATMGPAAKDFE